MVADGGSEHIVLACLHFGDSLPVAVSVAGSEVVTGAELECNIVSSLYFGKFYDVVIVCNSAGIAGVYVGVACPNDGEVVSARCLEFACCGVEPLTVSYTVNIISSGHKTCKGYAPIQELCGEAIVCSSVGGKSVVEPLVSFCIVCAVIANGFCKVFVVCCGELNIAFCAVCIGMPADVHLGVAILTGVCKDCVNSGGVCSGGIKRYVRDYAEAENKCKQ